MGSCFGNENNQADVEHRHKASKKLKETFDDDLFAAKVVIGLETQAL
jgi:hypothetical protein